MQTLTASPPELRPWIEQIWYSQGALPASQERVLPSATCELVVNLGAPMLLLQGRGEARMTGAIVSGLMTRPLLIGHPQVHEAIGMRVSPLGLRALIHAPAAALADYNAALADVLEAPHDALAARCRQGRTPHEVLALAIAWARERVASRPAEPDPLVVWSVAQLMREDARMRVDTLVRRSGYGATRFRQRFVDELGVTPQTFARLIRFRRALEQLRADTPLIELALQLGYADQAHLCRDFQRFGATTPTQVLARRNTSGLTLAEG